ncbi:nucleotidyltransferase domain-containing protein, partial [Salmonella sp. s54836]|uniref:nucleotidyltransferase domain-containing protein n=1 Tax=Salmonella sp. s54836 TaxID=3159673 RepID=UPI003980940C
PTPSEKRARTELISRVRHIALREWPDCNVEVFGSFSTQTYLPSSDIDLVIFGEWPSPPLKFLERELVNSRLAREDEIKVLDRNHVPLIRFTDITTKIRVDVSFNMTTGP